MNGKKRRRLEGVGHPHGVLPKGNAWLEGGESINQAVETRTMGLGDFHVLSDQQLLEVFSHFSPVEFGTLMKCSKMLYAIASHEDLWQEAVISSLGGNFKYQSSWLTTYVNSVFKLPAEKLIRSTKLSGIYSDILYQRWLCSTLPINSRWISHESIPRRFAADLSYEDFKREYLDNEGHPVIIVGAFDHWPAMKKWRRDRLINAYPQEKFLCGPVEMTLKDFYSYADSNTDEAPLFVFDTNTFGSSSAVSDYDVPEYFEEDYFTLLKDQRPDYRWLLIGNRRSGSKWHVDPNATHAWNAVISGRKRWMFTPPNKPPPGVNNSPDGSEVIQPVCLLEWYINYHQFASPHILEGTCNAGELVFVPSQWWHAVLNLDNDTVAVTQNFVSKSNLEKVRNFLRTKPDQISGVSQSRKSTLAAEFDGVLMSKGIVKPSGKPLRRNPQPEPSRGVSFFDRLRNSNATMAIS